MENRYSHDIRKIDRFLLLLLFILIFLISLFGYLYTINKDVKNYDLYQSKLLVIVSQGVVIKDTFLQTYRFIDYDKANIASKMIYRDIEFLKKSDMKSEFGMQNYQQLLNIERLFKMKMTLLEQFHSPNARAANALHYLFDLRKSIREKFPNYREYHPIMDDIFFQFGRVLMGLELELDRAESRLLELKKYVDKDRLFLYFYRQADQFFKDVAIIDAILSQRKTIHFLEATERLSVDLRMKYEENLQQQKLITVSFFTIAFLVVITLFIYYGRFKRLALELLAFRYAIEHSDNEIVITDADRNIEYVNDIFEENTGYKREEVIGKNPRILKSDRHSGAFYREMNHLLDQGKKWNGELVNKRKDGSIYYEKISIVPIFINQELVQYLAIKLNITHHIEQRQKLQQSAVAYETIGDGIIIADKNKKIVSVNPALLEIFGYTEEELIGEGPTVIDILEGNTLFYNKMWSTLLSKNSWRGRVNAKIKNGRYIPTWLTITVVKDERGAIQNFVVVYANLEEIIDMKERVDFLAYHDSLTQLPNRIFIEKELSTILELAESSCESVAVLFVDLDRFKVINDTLGHNIGDEILIVLSQRIQKIIGKNNIVARFGGDEFIIVMSNIRSRDAAGLLANKILSVIRDTIKVRDYTLNTSASIGISLFPENGKETSILIKNADSAMYDAKDQGKDNYRFYTHQLSVDMQTRLDLEQKLLYALERDEIYILYQPQYRLGDRQMCGVEALMRWNSPELGEVSPELFIAVAEETGVIVKLGYYVFEEASKAYESWREQGVALEWIAVNISGIQFKQKDLYEKLTASMLRTGISASSLELEITEGCMIDSTDDNLNFIKKFREMGGSISVDDFGTGYSSMSYLKTLPLDKVKIDKSFVDHLPHKSSDKEVAIAIVKLSQKLGYKVIAEGIEQKEQEEFLQDQGCDYGQGYYYSKPLSSQNLIEFAIKSKNRLSSD